MMTLKTMQLACGISQPLFQYPTAQISHLERYFYKHLQNFLASHNVSLEIAGIETVTPSQEYNRCIMDVVCSNDDIPDRDIIYIYIYIYDIYI